VPLRVGIVASVGSAGYHDFVQELRAAPFGWKIETYDVRVQGRDAPGALVHALRTADDRALDVIALIRGGGARSELAVFDAEPLAIEQVAKGEIDAMVVQNPFEMGYQGIRLMKSLVEGDLADVSEMLPNYGKSAQGDLYDTGLKVVVPDQGSQLTPDLFDAKCQYMKLSEFRQWLEKYGLKGS